MTDYPIETRISHLESDMGATTDEFRKLNEFWIEKYNDLKHAMLVAIGVRNAKIKEQAGHITTLKNNIDSLTGVCYELSEKITTLEQQLKKLTEQVDLNSQTLEALQ